MSVLPDIAGLEVRGLCRLESETKGIVRNHLLFAGLCGVLVLRKDMCAKLLSLAAKSPLPSCRMESGTSNNSVRVWCFRTDVKVP
jgi:hypothetical protein